MVIKYLSVIVIVFATIVFAIPPSLTDESLENTNGTNITDGLCDSTPDSELVYTHHVSEIGIPFFKRSDTATYYGDPSIYCIKVINLNSGSNVGHVSITAGGVGHHFAEFYMISDTSHGIEFLINIFAN
ncbi:uncharacterized protein LOC115877442 [Sitophilus oryzae]|uniref:Uncharacterized protein LOC115877442 n=1 Tax=Sitophilus oryzae TaxID=7048 RepID=A0A6J2XE73_SITOR|nr:uncharacterized protein LOC115877442 [Sitophilus oryzae]